MVDANLLISHDPCHISSAKENIDKIFKLAKRNLKFLKSDIDGLFKLRVKEPKKFVKELAKTAKKDISKFDNTFQWIPIDKWCKSNIKEMQGEIKKLARGIRKTDKWKMELNKRKYNKEHTTGLILKLTEVVDRPRVDLDTPQKIITVEIIGNKAGLALLNPDEKFNIHKYKQ